ncbi:hypothetical protein ACL02T_23875 [Pseudonocardia sp. RS010]|uniref:hypothetical protein n=1 Tax=Pseudonocardia sp. RS010 TaxID=3385979 RepID=UPI0039A217D6
MSYDDVVHAPKGTLVYPHPTEQLDDLSSITPHRDPIRHRPLVAGSLTWSGVAHEQA